ncbi:MAG TPA: alpha/beta hydrolase [Gaiellaceae bacterium]|nr:alpha/beta hydrolase [Gaiellaceae bacterium]
MPIGLLVPVVLVGWGTACALTRWRRLGAVARIPALVTNELPFLGAYLLTASTALAAAQGDLDSVGGVIVAVAALVVLLGLGVIVRRALLADAALDNPRPARRPWRRILIAPLPAFRRDVVRVRDLSYGEGPRRNLDVYHRRDRPTGVPVVLHFHGGGFHSGNKRREARPLIGHLVSNGMVCASADYRLRPRVGYDEQLADAMAAIEWVRSHAREYGGDPDRIFLVGSSAGAYLAVDAVNAGTSGVTGIVGRYGYYGGLVPERPQPPLLAIAGENDLLVNPSHVREFIERMRACSSHGARYVELPGGHHDFDLYESIRSNAVSIAVERFIATASG